MASAKIWRYKYRKIRHQNCRGRRFVRINSLVKLWNYGLDWKPHRNYIDGHKVAIVCSARSGSTKALGTTNLLLRAASEALNPRKKPVGSSGSVTPVSRALFGIRGHSSCASDHSQSPSKSPEQVRTRPPSPTLLSGFTPLNVPASVETLPEYHLTVDLIRREHLAAARSSVHDPDILKELEEEIEKDCEWLRSFLLAAKVCFTPFYLRFLIWLLLPHISISLLYFLDHWWNIFSIER